MLRHGLAILALTLLLFTGCATTPQSGPLRTPTAAELSRIDDALTPVVRAGGFRVTQECPVRVWVEQSTSMNAGGTVVDDPACPGTIRMFFTTGLLDGMTFLELRAIIAHELGHVALNHGATAAHRRQNEAMARNASSATWGVVGAAGSAIPVYGPAVQLGAWVAENVTNLTIGLVARGYDRDQEREADRWAARILLRLDGTEGCRYLQSAFQRLARANPRGLELFATHPDAGDRAEDARLLCEVGARPEDVKSR